MITAYARKDGHLTDMQLAEGQTPPADTVWIDLLSPENSERTSISTALGISLPTLAEMQEIETSSRLYNEGNVLYLTTDVVIGADTPDPVQSVLLIAVTPRCLVTVRFGALRSVDTFAKRIKQQSALCATVEDGLLALLDAVTDRLADILEVLGRDVDSLSKQIFRRGGHTGSKEKRLEDILQGIGRAGDTTHKVRDGITGMSRLVTFLGPRLAPRLSAEQLTTFQALDRDIVSLNEHAQFFTQETSFLLDATLGQINIEQNNIIKILSIVMVVFTPPTFFASMWGMNFHAMPEYAWAGGYVMALSVMLISAVVPLAYFRRRGWL